MVIAQCPNPLVLKEGILIYILQDTKFNSVILIIHFLDMIKCGLAFFNFVE